MIFLQDFGQYHRKYSTNRQINMNFVFFGSKLLYILTLIKLRNKKFAIFQKVKKITKNRELFFSNFVKKSLLKVILSQRIQKADLLNDWMDSF